jgi:hypothetical protein
MNNDDTQTDADFEKSLLKWLRSSATQARVEGFGGWATTFRDAADKIEQLQRDRSTWKKAADEQLLRAEGLEDEIEQLRRELDEAREISNNSCACVSDGRGELISECQEHERIREEAERYRKAIEDAPHGDFCPTLERRNSEYRTDIDFEKRFCDCWKSEALGDE